MTTLAHSNVAWTCDDLPAAPAWNYTLSGADVAEIDAAVRTIGARGMALEAVRAGDFPLAGLAATLARIGAELEHGTGAVRILGLPVARYSTGKQRLLFWGLAQHLGTCMSQSDSGELMMNIRDAGGDPSDPTVRGVHSRGGLHYHTDVCDVVGMLSLQTATRGGQSMLINSIAVHDEIARTRPDLLEALYRPFCYARPEWDGHGMAALDMRPIFAVHRGRFISTYLRDFIDWAQEDERVPRLDPLQREALDYLDRVCADPRLSYTFMLEAGDMLFFNSFVTYHSRQPYHDAARGAGQRDLLRLWLAVPDSRELPPAYALAFGDVRGGALRGGIHPAAPRRAEAAQTAQPAQPAGAPA